ncbi:hypothetical protein EVG20_g7473 [Dentipellis fragilis]|uniref:DUF6535 domain-containing protein n=1 Tax=Dentipellis fragilis TaxID=205917 RepID=A0A4Y9YE52_9AGAM|nr:hypothetical protein EVG20_g7473 [Dentipellis fragilis]
MAIIRRYGDPFDEEKQNVLTPDDKPSEKQPDVSEIEGDDRKSSTRDAKHGSSSNENISQRAQDYDERAANLWSVYVQEAESHDRALIETWKDDMEGIIIFAGLYSASLTAFLVESYQNLQPDPAQETIFLLNQSVSLLAQISQQLGPNGSQISRALPQSIPAFSPQPSDVRVNVFWFMSLVFSLGAALAATIVQQWVRDYMHVFQRYNNSLKRARVRQFLYEGAVGWNMSIVVDGIPALIHISLFLFFIGLSDFLFSLNHIVAIMTTLVISFFGVAYIWSMVSPVLYAQSPYQTPLTGIFWWFVQTFRARQHSDNSTSGERRLVSTNMTDGRVELAMDESDDRQSRDARAILWVIDNLTEDSELEPFVVGIPGSLSSPWGKKVWENVAKYQPFVADSSEPSANHSSSETGTHHDAVNDLSDRITRLMKTCTEPGILSEQARRKRARACVDAALSLVLSMDGVSGEWRWFIDSDTMSQALVYLGVVEKIKQWPSLPPSDFDSAFAARWMCMAILATRKSIQQASVRDAAGDVIATLSYARAEDSSSDDSAIQTAGVLDKRVKKAWTAAQNIHERLVVETDTDKMDEVAHKILVECKDDITDLEYMWNVLGWADELDTSIMNLVHVVMEASGGVLVHLPGAAIEWPAEKRRLPEKIKIKEPKWLIPQLLPPQFLTERLWLCAWNLRNLASTGTEWLEAFSDFSAQELQLRELQKLMGDTEGWFKIQLWRIQDIRDGGLVYMLELFVTAIRTTRQLSPESRPLYIATLQSITANWKSHRNSLGTQKCLVALLRDVLPTAHTSGPGYAIPAFVVDAILELVGNIIPGSQRSLVNEALSLVDEYFTRTPQSTVARSVKDKLESPGRPG